MGDSKKTYPEASAIPVSEESFPAPSASTHARLSARELFLYDEDDARTRVCGIPDGQVAAVVIGSLLFALATVGVEQAWREVSAREEALQAAALHVQLVAEEEVSDALMVSPANPTDMSGAQAAVEALAAPYGEGVAVSVAMLDGTGSFDINGDASMQSASMIKLAVLAEYLREVDDGLLSSEETYTLAASDLVGGSGSMQDDPVGTVYTLDEVARRMIAASDNVATNVLIDRMGVAACQARVEDLGLGGTKVAHKLMIAANDGSLNMISANDAVRLLAGVGRATIASPESCGSAVEYLLDQEDDEGLVQGLPEDVAFGHKTGSLDGIRHDGGIVFAEHPYAICVLTRGLGDEAANALMARISAAVYDELG